MWHLTPSNATSDTLQTGDGPADMPLVLTPDAKKALVRSEGKFKVVPFGGGPARGGAVPTDEIDMMIDHEAEWAQIYDESWRITRDNFYVENMHGVDWNHMREKYGQMLPYVKHRDDLTYLIGELIGELNIGHAYITSGEKHDIPRIATGLLGATYSKDKGTGAFKIEKIFRGADWDATLRCPLRAPGVDAKVGEYIVEVNGTPAKDLVDPGQALICQVFPHAAGGAGIHVGAGGLLLHGALRQVKRPLHGVDDVAHGDLAGRPGQLIAALRPAHGLDQLGPAQRAQQLLQIRFRRA